MKIRVMDAAEIETLSGILGISPAHVIAVSADGEFSHLLAEEGDVLAVESEPLPDDEGDIIEVTVILPTALCVPEDKCFTPAKCSRRTFNHIHQKRLFNGVCTVRCTTTRCDP